MKQLLNLVLGVGMAVALAGCGSQQAAPIANLGGFYNTDSATSTGTTTTMGDQAARASEEKFSSTETPKLVMKPNWKYASAQAPKKKSVSVKIAKKPSHVSKPKRTVVVKHHSKPVRHHTKKHTVAHKAAPKKVIHQPVVKTASNTVKFPVKGQIEKATKTNLQILASKGELVKAAASGKVLYTGPSIQGSGKMVIVKHDNGVLTAYSHLGKVSVKEGQAIAKGNILGKVSTRSGHQTIAFQVRKNGSAINPKTWLGVN